MLLRSLMLLITSQCARLILQLRDKVSYLDSLTYKLVKNFYFSAQEEELSSACVIASISSKNVTVVLKILASLQANFIVHEDEHILNVNIMNINFKVTINLRHMNTVISIKTKA